jgi:hypothetical protein
MLFNQESLREKRRLKSALWSLFLFFILTIGGASQGQAAIAFRSKSFNYTGTSTTSLTVSEPAGAANNDILFMFVVANGNPTFSTPTGWTQVFTPYQTTTDKLAIGLYWIRRSSTAPTYTISWTGSLGTYPWVEVGVTCWSGAITSGTPYEGLVKTTNYRAPPAYPDPSAVTTTVANTMVIAFGMTWSGWATTATPPTGYTIAEGGVNGANNDTAVAYKAVATVGTENPGAFTGLSNSTNWYDIVEAALALKPASTPVKVFHRVISE